MSEPAHVDFLRRMAEIDAAYDRGTAAPDDRVIAADQGATVVDFAAARQRLRR